MSVTMAVVPSTLTGDRRSALDRLCEALSRFLKYEVTGVLPDSYAELAHLLERDRVQYAWMSPALMVLTSERIQLQPLLSAVRHDRNEYCAALFVDANGPAQTLQDLQGKTVAWVDPASAAGYLLPRIHLAARGIDPSDLFGEELFLGSHAAVVRAVASGRAALGATYAEQPIDGAPLRRAGFLDVTPDHPMRVLEWTQPIPNDVIVGHGLLARADHRVFGNAVLTLTEREDGRRLLHDVFATESFMTTPHNALRPLMTLVEIARARGLLAQM